MHYHTRATNQCPAPAPRQRRKGEVKAGECEWTGICCSKPLRLYDIHDSVGRSEWEELEIGYRQRQRSGTWTARGAVEGGWESFGVVKKSEWLGWLDMKWDEAKLQYWRKKGRESLACLRTCREFRHCQKVYAIELSGFL